MLSSFADLAFVSVPKSELRAGCLGGVLLMKASFGNFSSGLCSGLAPSDCNWSRLVVTVETASALGPRIGERSLCLFRCKMRLQPPCPDLSQ